MYVLSVSTSRQHTCGTALLRLCTSQAIFIRQYGSTRKSSIAALQIFKSDHHNNSVYGTSTSEALPLKECNEFAARDL